MPRIQRASEADPTAEMATETARAYRRAPIRVGSRSVVVRVIRHGRAVIRHVDGRRVHDVVVRWRAVPIVGRRAFAIVGRHAAGSGAARSRRRRQRCRPCRCDLLRDLPFTPLHEARRFVGGDLVSRDARVRCATIRLHLRLQVPAIAVVSAPAAAAVTTAPMQPALRCRAARVPNPESAIRCFIYSSLRRTPAFVTAHSTILQRVAVRSVAQHHTSQRIRQVFVAERMSSGGDVRGPVSADRNARRVTVVRCLRKRFECKRRRKRMHAGVPITTGDAHIRVARRKSLTGR